MLKIVIDTNIWISALLNPGKAKAIRIAFEEEIFELYCSPELLDDLQDALSKPKLTSRIFPQDAADLIKLIEEQAVFVELGTYPAICRDPEDDAFLACAVISMADFLITGDDDLLCLTEYKGTKIITPARFLELLHT